MKNSNIFYNYMQDKFKFLLNNIMISTILMISTKNISNAEKIFQD